MIHGRKTKEQKRGGCRRSFSYSKQPVEHRGAERPQSIGSVAAYRVLKFIDKRFTQFLTQTAGHEDVLSVCGRNHFDASIELTIEKAGIVGMVSKQNT